MIHVSPQEEVHKCHCQAITTHLFRLVTSLHSNEEKLVHQIEYIHSHLEIMYPI